MDELRQTITSVRRPTDSTERLLSQLNVQFQENVALDSTNFLPEEFLPQRPYVFDSDLESMLTELNTENEDAFREVLRQKPKEGRPKPRVAYSRNFFGNLEDVSRYCDDSADKYFDVIEDAEEKNRKNDKTNLEGSADEQVDEQGDSQMTDSTAEPSIKPDAQTAPHVKPMYTGIRLGNLNQIPPSSRSSLVRNFIKMAMHKFSCRDYDISPRERLRIRDINIPQGLVMYNFVVTRLPADRTLARARHVEGPLMGVSVRHECIFHDDLHRQLLAEGREKKEVGECLGSEVDLLREVGSALTVATQRHREGKKRDEEHVRQTKDWWWASNPRFGGAAMRWGMLASEVFEDEDPSWSPQERELQMQKRSKAQDEMKKIEEAANKSSQGLEVADLLAKTEQQAQPEASPTVSPTAGLLSETSNRIPTLTPISSNTPAIESADNASSLERPPKKKHRHTINERVRMPSYPSQGMSPQEREDRREKDREEKAEYKDGRRIMYTAPMRRKWFREWATVRPNGSTWDEKVIWRAFGSPADTRRYPDDVLTEGYEAARIAAHIAEDQMAGESAGQGGEGGYDNVFQLSCINHHVALVKLRVSKRYLRWLETGDLEAEGSKKPNSDGITSAELMKQETSSPGNDVPMQDPDGADSKVRDDDVLHVYRSRYYDLFDVEQRKEFFTAVWRVMSWLCRAEVPLGEWGRTAQARVAAVSDAGGAVEESGGKKLGMDGDGALPENLKESTKVIGLENGSEGARNGNNGVAGVGVER
jgi:hypothetical protein